MAPSAELVALVDKIPPLDSKDYKPPLLKTRPSDGKFTGPTWEEAVEIFDPILKGGKDSIVGVIDMLKEVDDGSDYKARYVLHGLAQYVCRADKAKQQDLLVHTLIAALDGRAKPIQKFIIRQLQVCGDGRASDRVGKFLLDDEMSEDAALALTAIREGAVEQFRTALRRARGKARVTAVQNLGVLRDASSAAVLRRAARDSDEAVRIAAVWALANIGDAGSVGVVIKATGAQPGWERVQATKAALLLAEKLLAAGRKDDAKGIYTHLRDTRKDESESYVRQAAAKALAKM